MNQFLKQSRKAKKQKKREILAFIEKIIRGLTKFNAYFKAKFFNIE